MDSNLMSKIMSSLLRFAAGEGGRVQVKKTSPEDPEAKKYKRWEIGTPLSSERAVIQEGKSPS